MKFTIFEIVEIKKKAFHYLRQQSQVKMNVLWCQKVVYRQRNIDKSGWVFIQSQTIEILGIQDN